jgi:hypothetical protein
MRPLRRRWSRVSLTLISHTAQSVRNPREIALMTGVLGGGGTDLTCKIAAITRRSKQESQCRIARTGSI